MKHQIIVRYSNRADRSLPLTLHLRKCIAAALEAEHVNVPCEINVLVTDDAGIRAINRAMRNIDRETDVLSFPMFQFTPGQFPEDVQEDIDPADRSAAAGRYGYLARACAGSGQALRQFAPPRDGLSDDPLHPAPAGL